MRLLIIMCVGLAAIMPARAQDDIPQIEWETGYASWVAALELERRCASLFLYEAKAIHGLIEETEKALPTWHKAHGNYSRNNPRDLEKHQTEVAEQRDTALAAVSSFTCEQANASMLSSARNIIGNRVLKDLIMADYVFNGTVTGVTLKPTESQINLRGRLIQVVGSMYGESWQGAQDNAQLEVNKELQATPAANQRGVVIGAYRRIEAILEQLLVELTIENAGHRIDVNRNDPSLYAITPKEGGSMLTVSDVDALQFHTDSLNALMLSLKGIDETGRLVMLIFDDGEKTEELDALGGARLLVQKAPLTGSYYEDNWRQLTTSHEGSPLAPCPAKACFAFPAEATEKIVSRRTAYDKTGYSYNAEYYIGTAAAFPIPVNADSRWTDREDIDIALIDYWIAQNSTAAP